MRKIFLCAILSLALGLGFAIHSANALILVSGDVNIVDPLTGAQSAPIDPGNQEFFTNILQGGSSVAVLEVTGDFAYYPDLVVDTFYDSLSGVSSTVISGEITDALLAGVDLFVAPAPIDAFLASEIAALSNFLDSGGTIFLLGDHAGDNNANQFINDALAALGSSMTITADSAFDPYVWSTATGPQITVDPLTADVATFTYAWSSQVAGGTVLFYGTGGQPFVAYEETAVPGPYEVIIDIKRRAINCSNAKGVIAVAILTTADFDATIVDHTTVTFEGASETHFDRRTGELRRHEEDVDYDGDTDLVFHFRLSETELSCDSTEATLMGETFDGLAIQGTDAVRMID